MIRITQACSLTRKGKRKNNQDAIWPGENKNLSGERLFLVCDGVGGLDQGEIASKIACFRIVEYAKSLRYGINTSEKLKEAVAYAKFQMREYNLLHSIENEMATTMTLLHLEEDGIFVGHIGDSRIYHIRDGKIKHQTKDHSLVQELVERGMLSDGQAAEHPQKNIITRSISSKRDEVEADTAYLDDLESGDFFMLCTDGILEGMSIDFITINFQNGVELEDLKFKIDELCKEQSRDNYSAIILQIELP